MLKKFFKRKSNEQPPEEELVPTPIPPLIDLLLNLEIEKGSPLTEAEVLEVRDNAICMMLPVSKKLKLEESRGYPDLDLEYAWEHWQLARGRLQKGS